MGVTGFKNATAEQLEHWADAILEAPTLEAVLAEHLKKCRTLKKPVCQKNKPPYRLHQPTFNRAHPGCGSHSRPGFTQRTLAKEVGINVSSINFCLKALVEKGWIKVGNFSKNPRQTGLRLPAHTHWRG